MINSKQLKFGTIILDNTVVIHLNGDFDSVLNLLQGQVTSDCSHISEQLGQISSLCDEKGFVLCNFEIIFDNNKWLIIIEEPSKDIFLDEISKFLPFYKVSAELLNCQVTGVTRKINEDLYSDEHVILQSDEALLTLIIKNKKQINNKLKMSDWAFNRKFLGDHQINFEEKGKYRPHELGQHITRVSFNKGCFKGQEIIARMEYLGKLKKETRLIVYSDKEEVSKYKIVGHTYQVKDRFFSSCLGNIDSFS